jgi:hypothetical protein
VNIKITNREETGRTVYTALTVSVEEDGESHKLETVIVQEYNTNPDKLSDEVGEFSWLTSPPEDSGKRIKIEEAAEAHILNSFKEDSD